MLHALYRFFSFSFRHCSVQRPPRCECQCLGRKSPMLINQPSFDPLFDPLGAHAVTMEAFQVRKGGANHLHQPSLGPDKTVGWVNFCRRVTAVGLDPSLRHHCCPEAKRFCTPNSGLPKHLPKQRTQSLKKLIYSD